MAQQQQKRFRPNENESDEDESQIPATVVHSMVSDDLSKLLLCKVSIFHLLSLQSAMFLSTTKCLQESNQENPLCEDDEDVLNINCDEEDINFFDQMETKLSPSGNDKRCLKRR